MYMWVVPRMSEIHGEFASCGRFHATVYVEDKGEKRAPLERFVFFVEAKLCCCLPGCAEQSLFGVREWLLRNVLSAELVIWSSAMLALDDYQRRDNPRLLSYLCVSLHIM
jgi:hypothetical protein